MKAADASRAVGRVVAERPWSMLVALVGVHLSVALLAFDPVPHTGGDNTAYLALARSLLEHGRYLELWQPGRPPHTQYPPGFPAILAVAWVVGIRGWMALKLMMVAFSATAVGSTVRSTRSSCPARCFAALSRI